MYREDSEAWVDCPDRDRWVFNKLEVARRSGHVCGPKGVPVPKPGRYVIRPIINLLGMGRGATIVDLNWCTMDIPDGYFWCEEFKGRHLSVDYTSTRQELTVEGFRRSEDPLWRWSKWKKAGDVVPFPDVATSLLASHTHFNIEYIGDKVIEIHLRHNPDWRDLDVKEMIPVFNGDNVEVPPGFYFKPSGDFERVGFLISTSL